MVKEAALLSGVLSRRTPVEPNGSPSRARLAKAPACRTIKLTVPQGENFKETP
jgi:hypothetical protein